MKGNGCELCAKEKQLKEKESNRWKYFTFFKEKAKIKFKNNFIYKGETYINFKTNMSIICPIHGIFKQRPDNHLNSEHGCPFCAEKQRRLKRIKRIEFNLKNGYQITPNFNSDACKIFDEISLKENIYIQHAQNGGEHHIKELGYWLDGYDKENNIVYEFDEKYHETKKQQEKDLIRQKEIINFLNCDFIRLIENNI